MTTCDLKIYTDTLWQMDSELSYAILTIQPIVSSGGTVYRINGELHVLPYPNPLKYGGCYWLPSDVRTIEDVKKLKALWAKGMSKWKYHGLVKDECIELPAKVISTTARMV